MKMIWPIIIIDILETFFGMAVFIVLYKGNYV